MFPTNIGNQLFLNIQGQGPALILLHSWCGSHLEWAKLMPELSKHFTVYAWDARGHGRSQLTSKPPYTLEHLADDLNDLISENNLVKPMIVGHSMGAFIMWKYLEKYGQDNVSKIGIIDQTPKLVTDDTWEYGIYGRFNERDNRIFMFSMQEDFSECVLKLAAFGHNHATRKKYAEDTKGIKATRNLLKAYDPKPLIEIWKELTESDFRTLLTELKIPTLLIYGEKSNYYGKSTAEFVHNSIGDSTLHLYEDADHSPHLKQPERFIQDLLEFSKK
ncbi:putative hydrolase or acyltransferase of alpha/beta superfamily [Candidatus Terasakiella magnetica]|uniref:Putative hydrolase or acyltransferase of alpha/beta superfamily n=1 Tax=Candidatus Terasakiella magnetica TaxID=1867952 RepID=A0A1C3RJG4_9PROT|nr:alpha/beta hydrolase [Candidatus Terasakiella magnetica]SCA57422.1 putative hydrolase or acyltransferase of alpha/beta superfamily [Candidatus Terasakiella magnetica]